MPRVFRLLLLVFVSVSRVSAQEPPFTLKVDVPFIPVDVSVEDTAGRPVNNLSADDFELYEDGIRQQIHYFSPVSTPYNVLLLLDRSGSTQHKWSFMQKAVAGFIASLRPQDHVAIGTFDSEFQMQVDWTADRGTAVMALPKLLNPKTIGGTNFYEALEHALRREFRQVMGRRAVLVLTDGRDTSLYRGLVAKNRLPETSEDRAFQKLLRTSRDQHIPTYFVALNTDKNLEPNMLGGDEYRNLQIIFPHTGLAEGYLTQVRLRMDQIAEVSGGRILFPERIDEIIDLYEQIGRELGMSYSLGYISSNSGSNGSFRKIEVRTRAATLRLSQSRAGYYAR